MAPAPKSTSRRVFEIIVGLAGILTLIIGIPAAINETKKLRAGHEEAESKPTSPTIKDEKPVPQPSQVTIDQTGNQGGTQIGQVTGGTVSVVNQSNEAPRNKVFNLIASFHDNVPPDFGPPNPPKPLNYYVAGKVSVTYNPQSGEAPYVVVCFVDDKELCTINEVIPLHAGTDDYNYKIDEPGDDKEWSKRPTDTVRACIGDTKRLMGYFSMSADQKVLRQDPVCLTKEFQRKVVEKP